MYLFDHVDIFSFSGEEDAALAVLLAEDVDIADIESEDVKVTAFVP
ncbi:MAG: hypothetical protein PF483_16330 [Halothiobacillus sp.]|jgi:hypothetical protein|nr:hypothetical protein [Halothiobacillus sp.]